MLFIKTVKFRFFSTCFSSLPLECVCFDPETCVNGVDILGVVKEEKCSLSE